MFFACAKAGFILLPLNWRLAAPELRFQLDDAEPSVFLVEPEYDELAAATGHGFEPLARLGPDVDGVTAELRGRGPLLLIYTSGTTGGRRARCSRTRTASGRTSSFDLATGSPATTSCCRCCRSSTRRLERAAAARLVEGREGRARARVRRRRACCR